MGTLADIRTVMPFEGLFDGLPLGLQIYSAAGRPLYTNPAFRSLLGESGADLFGPEPLARALAGETVNTPHAWSQLDGAKVAASAIFLPLCERAGGITHVALVVQDVTREVRAREESARRSDQAEAARQRATFLAEAARLLAADLDYETTLQNVAQLVVPLLGDNCTVDVVTDDGKVSRAAEANVDPSKQELLRRLRQLASQDRPRVLPASRTIATGETILIPELSDQQLVVLAAGNPEYLALARAVAPRSSVIVPLRSRGRVLGAISFGRSMPDHPYLPEDIKLAEEIGALAGLAVDNALLLKASLAAQRLAEEASDRATFLTRASEALATSQDFPETARCVAEMAIERLCEWCSVDRLDGVWIRTLAVAHRDPAKLTVLRELHARFPARLDDGGSLASAIHAREAIFVPEITEELVTKTTPDPERREYVLKLGLASLIVVPIVVRGEAVGTLNLATSKLARRLNTADLELARELALRAAVAVENARLLQAERAAREHAEAAQAVAQEAVALRDQFLSIAGHELKTPLTALLIHAQGLQRAVLGDPAARRFGEKVEKTISAGARLDKLITQLLDVSRITAGRLRLEPESVDLVALVREAVARHAEAAVRMGCSVGVKSDGALIGRWDQLRIEQVVTNLFDNALKYGRGKPVEVELWREGYEAILRVTDHGIGIPEDYQQRIFGRFERAVAVREYGGFGLGLWITRQIVDASGGKIVVHSRPGEGASFTVTLPLEEELSG